MMTSGIDDAPLTLQEACARYFRGAIGPATLRAEARRGRLALMRIGRTDFVTPAAMREMMEKCRVPQKEPAFGSTPPKELGSSGTEDRSFDAQAAARASANALKKRSATTSPKSSSQPPAKVISLASRSQKS